jgi:uncharacterized protein (DUF433 family)
MPNVAAPIARDPELLEGQATFAGTRVPVWVLFNYLADTAALAAFEAAYPQVERASILAALDEACRLLTGQDSHGEDAPQERQPAQARGD